LGTDLQKSREGIEEAEKQAGPKVQEAVDRTKAAAKKGTEQTASGIDRAAASTIAGAERAGAAVKAKTDRAVRIIGQRKLFILDNFLSKDGKIHMLHIVSLHMKHCQLQFLPKEQY
jgi:hypothetical protein